MAAHGVGFETTEDWWSSTAPTPPYYSDFVTRTPIGVQDQVRQPTRLVPRTSEAGWSVADSFACLDVEAMHRLGFELLFDATWFGRVEQLDHTEGSEVRFQEVSSEAELVDWELRWQEWSPTGGARVFPAALLASPDRQFWTAYQDGLAVGGAITHAHQNTLGLSNVFANGKSAHGTFLRQAARLAIARAAERMVVGYGSDRELEDLSPLGFRSLGRNRIWRFCGRQTAGGRTRPPA